MENPQHFECDTPDCCYWSEDGCTKGTAITIQEHHCVDYEEQPKPGSLTVTIGTCVQCICQPGSPRDPH